MCRVRKILPLLSYVLALRLVNYTNKRYTERRRSIEYLYVNFLCSLMAIDFLDIYDCFKGQYYDVNGFDVEPMDSYK